MGFGEDLRGELFGKLGVESNVDPLKLIEQGIAEKSSGNNQGAKKAFEQAVEISNMQAQKFMGQSQHRAAAEALYIQAVATGHLGETDSQTSLYSQVIVSLLAAGKSALAFGENNRGMASGTLAGMVALLLNDQERAFKIYEEFMGVTQQKENAAFLQKLLYSLGYLLDALKNDNIGALTDAQNYMSTDLRPLLSTTKLTGFDSLLDGVLRHCQDVLQSRITMPKLVVGTSLPKDIQFNQLFEFNLQMTNSGDGMATHVDILLNIPDDIEIVDGKSEELIDQMDAADTLDRTLTLRFQTGDSAGAQVRDIKGHVSYVDMLGNSHKQFVGPIEIEFTAVSKKEEFSQQLIQSTKALEDLSTSSLHGSLPAFTLTNIQGRIDGIRTLVQERIEAEEFPIVEFGLRVIEDLVKEAEALTSDNASTQMIEEQLSQLIQASNDQLKQTLTIQFDHAKEQALADLTTQKAEELDKRVEQLKTDLSKDHQAEMNALKDEHQTQLQEVRREGESKLNQALTQHENKLREEFKKEFDNLTQSNEANLSNLQEQQKQLIEDAEQKIKGEWSLKFDTKVQELESSMEEMKKELQSSHEEELRGERQKHSEEIAKKDAEIAQLNSNSNPPQ